MAVNPSRRSFNLYLRGIALKLPVLVWLLFKIDHDRSYRWFIPEDYWPESLQSQRHL